MYHTTVCVRRALFTYLLWPRPRSGDAFIFWACSKHLLHTRGRSNGAKDAARLHPAAPESQSSRTFRRAAVKDLFSRAFRPYASDNPMLTSENTWRRSTSVLGARNLTSPTAVVVGGYIGRHPLRQHQLHHLGPWRWR